jgi:peptide deformylase
MAELQAAELQIIELGHPTLRQIAQPVLDVSNDRLQSLIDQLRLTIQQTNGVGIAAPQVDCSDRLFIVASHPNSRYPNAPKMLPIAVINPKILAHSDEQVDGWEGCLSVPGIRGFVPRYRTIAVEYTGRDGKLYQQEFTDFIARIFQHELDHLDGLLFLDRVKSSRDLMSEKEFQRQILT